MERTLGACLESVGAGGRGPIRGGESRRIPAGRLPQSRYPGDLVWRVGAGGNEMPIGESDAPAPAVAWARCDRQNREDAPISIDGNGPRQIIRLARSPQRKHRAVDESRITGCKICAGSKDLN